MIHKFIRINITLTLYFCDIGFEKKILFLFKTLKYKYNILRINAQKNTNGCRDRAMPYLYNRLVAVQRCNR
ncbi:MAG: hypothetical protein RIS64_2186 [Bacteroidota bacterium]|jgi:hypothetical protein